MGSDSAFENLRTFAATTTIRGLPKLMKSKTVFQSALWFLTLLGGAAMVAYQLQGLLREYLSYDTTISYSITTKTARFPDVTMCNLNPTWSDDHVQKTLNSSIASINFIVSLEYRKLVEAGDERRAGLLLSLLNTAGIMQNVNVTEIMRDPTSNPVISCATRDRHGRIDMGECTSHIRPVFTPQFGICFTYSHPVGSPIIPTKFSAILFLNDFQTQGMSNFFMNPAATFAFGARVLVHAPDTFPDMNDGISIAPGTEATFPTEAIEHKDLGKPYSSCQNHNPIKAGNVSYTYTRKLCRESCIQRYIFQTCGCFKMELMTLNHELGNGYFCGKNNVGDIEHLLGKLECSRDAMVGIAGGKDAANCSCFEPCQYTRYATEVRQAPWPHEAFQLSFYHNIIRHSYFKDKFAILENYTSLANNQEALFEELRSSDLIRRNFLQVNVEMEANHTVIQKSQPTVTGFSLTGNVGGILNLWLGVNFATFIELIDTCYLMIMAKVKLVSHA